MNDLMVDNPPAPEDAPMAIEAAPGAAWEKIAAYTAQSGTVKQGWLVNLKVGHYGTDYMARAWLSAFGIPANAPKDAVYPGRPRRRRRRAARLLEARLRHPLRIEGRAAAGQRLLVAHHVRHRLLPRAEPARPLHA